MQWFPSGTSRKAPEEVEAERIRAAAVSLKAVNADVVLLQEVRDFESCRRLAAEVGGLNVAICSRFREFGGTLGWQQVAILTKTEAVSAWTEDWKTVGTVDPPRGFAFAHLRFETNDVAVYAVHLKSNLIRGTDEKTAQLNILKRELAAEQLVRHLAQTETNLQQHFEAVVIGGDFNTSRDQFPSEQTFDTLQAAGLRSGFEGLPLKERITHPGTGKYPDATFDYIFARGFNASLPPLVFRSTVSDHCLVTRTLRLP